MRQKLFSILFILSAVNPGFSQTTELKKDDTLKINTLNTLSRDFISKGAYLKADSFINEALVLSEKLNFKRGLFNALTCKGVVFWYQDNYPKALDFYFKGLNVAEQMGNQLFIARSLTNIGLVYSTKKDFSKALEYYGKALHIKMEIKDRRGAAIILSNIAQIYNDKNENIHALQYYEEALKMDEDVEGNKGLIALNYSGIGNIYEKQGEYFKASEFYNKALNIAEETNDKVLMSSTLTQIGTLYVIQQNYEEAEPFLQRALNVAIEIGDLDNKRNAYRKLSEVYEKTNRWNLSLFNYKKYIQTQDSIFNEDNIKKTVRVEMNFEFDKKEAVTKLEQEKSETIAATENKKQVIIIWSVCGILILVGCFAIYAYSSFLHKQKANIEMTYQKNIIEEKQREIVDSIHYAKRIQTALITSDKYMERSLNKLQSKL